MPATDFKQAIDAKIRKLQMIRELSDDPEALALLRELLPSSNGNGAHSQTELPKESSGAPFKAFPIGHKLRRRGQQQRQVEDALALATEPVSTDWIVERMEESGYRFQAAKPRVAVNECLRYAEEHSRAKLVRTEGVTNYWEAVR